MTFTEDANAFLDDNSVSGGVVSAGLTVGDYDNDGDMDFLFGNEVYQNIDGYFIEETSLGYGFNIQDSTILGIWIDYDNDEDLDIWSTSDNYWMGTSGGLYENTGTDFQFRNYGIPLTNNVSWQDYDNDGDLDVFVPEIPFDPNQGWVYDPVTQLYENTGSDFVENTSVAFPDIRGKHSWIDYDNDNDLDILLTGTDNSNTYVTKLYQNIDGSFTEDTNVTLPGIDGSHSWIDYDNDGDLDLFLTGSRDISPFITNYTTKLYENTGGSFSENTNVILPTEIGNHSWEDYDNDGDSDLLVSISSIPSSYHTTKLYENTGNGFTENSDYAIPNVVGDVTWVDYDEDGDQDVFIDGYDYSYSEVFDIYMINSRIKKLYTNTGTGFTEDTSIDLSEAVDIAWVDYDNDEDLDILVASNRDNPLDWFYFTTPIVTAYQNNTFSSTRPTPPPTTDNIPPTATNFIPSDNETEVLLNQPLTITFDENVAVGSGNIIINKQTVGDEIVETIDVASDQVQIDGNTVTISPTNDLEELTDYYIEINPSAIVDVAGNNYSGIADNDSTTWNFTTKKNETVESSTDYTLETDRRNLILTGDEDINGTGNDQNNAINGNDGNNLIKGLAGRDTLRGADGNDILNGGNNNDRLNGGDGDDTLNGGSGNDILMGVDGDDRLIGRSGSDRLLGSSGNDTLRGGIGRDRVSVA